MLLNSSGNKVSRFDKSNDHASVDESFSIRRTIVERVQVEFVSVSGEVAKCQGLKRGNESTDGSPAARAARCVLLSRIRSAGQSPPIGIARRFHGQPFPAKNALGECLGKRARVASRCVLDRFSATMEHTSAPSFILASGRKCN